MCCTLALLEQALSQHCRKRARSLASTALDSRMVSRACLRTLGPQPSASAALRRETRAAYATGVPSPKVREAWDQRMPAASPAAQQ